MEFRGVVGHDRQKQVLSSFVTREKLPHALMFAGPRGVGKRTIAVEMVKNLFCEEGRACGVCRHCRNVGANHHPDFTLLTGETSIKIDEMRAVRKDVYEPPYQAPLRVILIDDADIMTREAANALLKTLEEPPPSNLFILVTSKEQEIPSTVRSRCMRIGFGPLSRDSVYSYFKDSLGMDGAQAELLANLSNGSIACGLFWGDGDNFGMRQRIAELLMGKKNGFSSAALVTERIIARGAESDYLSFLLSFFRDIWWLDQAGDMSGVVNSDLKAVLEQTGTHHTRWAEASIRRVYETMRTLRYNVNKWLTIQHLIINVMRPA